MRTRIAALIATLLAAPILAAVPASAAGLDGMGQAIFGNSFNFIKANIEKPPVKAIGVGKLTVQLQRTKLKDIQKAFGGTIRREGDEASRADWLCYSAEGANVWFISNALGGYEVVMMVAAESASKPSKNCAPNFGIPSLGGSTADLKATFGAASGNKIAYRSDRPGGYSDIAQYIGYVIKGGKVAGIGIGETSVQTAH